MERSVAAFIHDNNRTLQVTLSPSANLIACALSSHGTAMSPPPFIDVEASGFGSASYPIEVGLALPDGSAFCTLIQPQPDWDHWDAVAEKIHGIERDVLLRHGRSAAEVAREINERLRGQTVYCDSWYHDFNWLSRLYDAAGTSPSFHLEDLRALLNQEQTDNWRATKESVLNEFNLPRHRASNDARVLQATLTRLQASASDGTKS